MARRLAELSMGSVVIEIFPNGQLGSEPESIEQVQRGALALVKTSSAAMEGFVPDMAVFSLPYLFRDESHYWQVLEGEIGRELLRAAEPVGGIGLCYYDSGSRSFYTAHRPILRPEDVRGLKLRVLPSRMAMDMVSTFGGAPTPIPWGELYTALQQGMVDGAENNPPSLLSSRHYEVARHFSLNEHTRVPDILLMSKAIWDGLPPHVQIWVQQAADESVAFQRACGKKEQNWLCNVCRSWVSRSIIPIPLPSQLPWRDCTKGMVRADWLLGFSELNRLERINDAGAYESASRCSGMGTANHRDRDVWRTLSGRFMGGLFPIYPRRSKSVDRRGGHLSPDLGFASGGGHNLSGIWSFRL
ncbi:MAG: TRAP transporter substrate-binding protein [Verrucomicrobia bacterium]|nr:TRAP transporter substrate-binding protein [Verrucomicrobiota bacterium]